MTVRGSGSARVQVRGVTELQRALRPLLEPELTNMLDAENKKAAQALAKDVRAEAKPVSKHMAKAVRVKRAKTGKPGWVVGARRKVAWFWHIVIGGSKDHGPRNADAMVFIPGWNPYLGASSKGVGSKVVRVKRVRGVRANPIIERVVARREATVARKLENDIAKRAGL
jgi:hypothetical protein